MILLRRILGAVVLILATVGIVCCAAGVIGIPIGRPAVAQRIKKIDILLGAALQRTSFATREVQRALEKARADVNRVGKESAGLGADPVKDRLTAGILRKLIDREVGPNINDLGGRLATTSDAAVAAASLLRSFQELPLGQTSRIDPEKLERATEQASQLSAALQKLQTAIGEGDKTAHEEGVVSAANDVDRVLQRCQAILEDWQSQLDAVREARTYFEVHVSGWLTVATIAGTVLFAWVGLGQISLFAHAWKWFRRA